MTLLRDVIKEAMEKLHVEENKNWISLKDVYRKVEQIRGVANPNGGASIRRTIETYSEASDVYSGLELFVSKEKGTGLYKLIEYMNIGDLVLNKRYTGKQIESIYESNIKDDFIFSDKTKSIVFIIKHNDLFSNSNIISDNMVEYINSGDNLEFIQDSLESISNKKYKVYLFEMYLDDKYYFDGEVKISGVEEVLLDNGSRKGIKCLLRKKKADRLVVDLEDVRKSADKKLDRIKNLDKNKVKERAKQAGSKKKNTKEVKTTYRERDPYVASYTKERANGVCDLCNKDAPFKDLDGVAYLECHHVITLANDGPDTIYNTVALCPNCHKRMHILKSDDDNNVLKNKIRKYLVLDNDYENIKNFEELF